MPISHDFDELLSKIYSSVEETKEHAFSVSDDIAEHPELSGEEYRTSQIFCEWLKNEGFAVEMPYCGMDTAFIAKKGEGKPRVAILVEMDALPEVGHGCGHNLSGTMSALAGTAVGRSMDAIEGELLVIGTPAEETWGAKCRMADMGVMDDVDLAIMIHSTSARNLVSMTTPALQGWDITYTGLASHAAASPWEGRNAFNGARLFFDALDMMRQHVRPETRMHGIIKECGKAVNTVPDKAVIVLELRSPDKRYLEKITERVKKCAEGAAAATETELVFEKNFTSFDNTLELSSLEKIVQSGFEKVGLGTSEKEAPGGASDVGDISWRCPSIQPLLSIIDKPVALHTAELEAATRSELGHERLAAGAKIIAYTVLRIFLDEEARREVREEFLRKKNG